MHFDTTILVQGPLSDEVFEHIDDYKAVCNSVVVSCWESDRDISELEKKANVVVSRMEDVPEVKTTAGQETFPLAIYTTLQGLRRCPLEYVVKVRTDEFFTDLDPIIEELRKHDRRLVYGNVWLSKWTKRKYHVGDHVFAARKDTLLLAYEILFEAVFLDAHPALKLGRKCCAEQMLFKAFLKASGVDDEKIEKPDKGTMERMGKVFDVANLGDFRVRNNHQNKVIDSLEGGKV